MGSITFEVECEVEGQTTYDREERRTFVEGADISSVMMQVAQPWKLGEKVVWRDVDLLEGLDAKARDQVMANIMEAFRTEIEDAIIEDAK